MGRDQEEFLSHVLSNIYVNSDCDTIFLCGDFNARIGSVNDVSEFINKNIVSDRQNR